MKEKFQSCHCKRINSAAHLWGAWEAKPAVCENSTVDMARSKQKLQRYASW
ncbi:hypothetical protein [Undibacterium sp. JH2W]|uniref:hypothetical protein n=1 Tax=Undibacterium sp. JH2W TaxID=3413037 RepID=UPI003BF49F47